MADSTVVSKCKCYKRIIRSPKQSKNIQSIGAHQLVLEHMECRMCMQSPHQKLVPPHPLYTDSHRQHGPIWRETNTTLRLEVILQRKKGKKCKSAIFSVPNARTSPLMDILSNIRHALTHFILASSTYHQQSQ